MNSYNIDDTYNCDDTIDDNNVSTEIEIPSSKDGQFTGILVDESSTKATLFPHSSFGMENKVNIIPDSSYHPIDNHDLSEMVEGSDFQNQLRRIMNPQVGLSNDSEYGYNKILSDIKSQSENIVIDNSTLSTQSQTNYGSQLLSDYTEHETKCLHTNIDSNSNFHESSNTDQASNMITKESDSHPAFRGTTPPNYEKDGYIPKGTVRLERTVSGQKDTFDLYVKKGGEYIYEDGKWIRIDGSGTIKVNNIKYDKI